MFTGISERGRARLTRSSSQSSTDSPKHEPKHQPAPPTDPTSSNQKQTQSKPEVPTGSFFDTLDWSSPAESNTEPEKPETEVKVPEESEFSLLGNTSEDEDDFSTLRETTAAGQQEQKQRDAADLFNVQSNDQSDHFGSFTADFSNTAETKTEDVDFFNMNNTEKLAEDVDLMNLGKTPSNVDLLSGAGGSDLDMLGGDTGSKPSNNTFDPFHSFGSQQKQEAPPVTVTEPKNDFNTFDPFADFNGQSSNDSKPAKDESGGDLMGDWNAFMTNVSSSPSISRNSSSSNLLGGGGGIPQSNSGTFQSMGSGADLSRNSSGTFQPMGGMTRDSSGTFQGMQSGGSIPRNNSGTFQTMGGMGQNQGFGGTAAGSGKPADPFADLGMEV